MKNIFRRRTTEPVIVCCLSSCIIQPNLPHRSIRLDSLRTNAMIFSVSHNLEMKMFFMIRFRSWFHCTLHLQAEAFNFVLMSMVIVGTFYAGYVIIRYMVTSVIRSKLTHIWLSESDLVCTEEQALRTGMRANPVCHKMCFSKWLRKVVIHFVTYRTYQSPAEQVSKSNNKLLATTYKHFSRSL